MIILSSILFPYDAKVFEIREALRANRRDPKNGRTQSILHYFTGYSTTQSKLNIFREILMMLKR